jgi:hypothetical protein
MTQTFTQTSDKPYDRHHYKLVCNDGRELVFEYYQDVQSVWFQTPSDVLSHIEVLDKKKTKGFK